MAQGSAVTEREWQDKIVDLARSCGWRVAHFGHAQTGKGWRTPVRYDGKGFPDLVLVHPLRKLVWFRECKVGSATSKRGQPEPDQAAWGLALTMAGADYDVWRPADWESIVGELSEGRARAT